MPLWERCAVLAVVLFVQGCDILATNRSARFTEKITVRANGPCDVEVERDLPTTQRDATIEDAH